MAAAISIAQSGHAVTVFEAAKQLSEVRTPYFNPCCLLNRLLTTANRLEPVCN